ncbi:MAG: hypothetical protein IJ449_10155 [Clostridia bacterium]|nr:hypothetical protein [Clostridia bacterium]
MTKTPLTLDRIFHDAMQYHKHKIWLLTEPFSVRFVGGGLLALLLYLIVSKFPIVAAVVALYPLYVLIRYLYNLVRWYKEKKNLEHFAYRAVTDDLTHVSTETEYRPTWLGRAHAYHDVKCLNFGCGQWRIPPECYTWDAGARMTRSGICNTALAGDPFFVVVARETGEVLCAYNCKLFDCEDVAERMKKEG